MKLSKPKKLSAVLMLWIGALLLSLNLIATVVMAFVTGAGMNNKQDDFLRQTAINAQKQVEQFVDKYISVTEILADGTSLQAIVKTENRNVPISNAPELTDLTAVLRRQWRIARTF